MSVFYGNNLQTFSFGDAEHHVRCEKNNRDLNTQHTHQSSNHVTPHLNASLIFN